MSEDADGRRVIRAKGDLDLTTADALVATVGSLLAGATGAEVGVDLSAVDFIDSSGVRALLQARRAVLAQGGSLAVSGARGLVAEVLRITAVEQLLSPDAESTRSTGNPPAERDGG